MLRRVRGLRHRRRNHEQRNSDRKSKREHHTVSTFKSGTRETPYAALSCPPYASVTWRAAEIR